MSLSKLRKIHVIIIGSFLIVATGVAMFFLLIKPQREAFAAAEDRYNKAAVLGNQAAEDKAIRDLNDAIMKVGIAQQTLDMHMKKRMPDLSFARRDIGMIALWNEQIKTLGPLLESFARDKNVRVTQVNFALPAPPSNPNSDVFDKDALAFSLGSVTARGDFKGLMNNIRRWNNCSRLVMVGPPELSGNSPDLSVTYSLTCFIFPVAKGGAPIPMAGAQTATAPGTTF